MVKVGSSTDADQCTASKDLDSEISAANNQESTHEMIQLLAKQIEDLKLAINLYSSRVSQNQEKLEEIQLKINQDKSKEIELKKKLDNLMKAQSLLIESCREENTNQENVEIQTDQNVTINEKINLPTTSRGCNDRRNSVKYPIDLSTIKARFENRFYRRITSAQFDVRYSATNAEKFNERHSQIVNQARLITDICLHLIKKTTEHDITALYHELADAYHFSDTEVNVEDDIDKPSTKAKAPYYPQMGDEIVYFRQGHKRYLDAVKENQIYYVNRSLEPWSKLKLKAHEFVKVIGIKYEIRPPRLCCLKLAQMDEDGHLTGMTFTIEYHDVPNVLNFLVLRQTFDNALERNWSEGNRFRCMVEDGWWTGQIIDFQPLSDEFTDSYFMCFKIRWDNGETEFMSPWDLEPIDEQRLPSVIGDTVPVLPEEIQETLYQPQPEEWPMGDREAACRRIIRGLDQVMTLAIAEPFIAPVDLNVCPSYAFVVEYPIDLSTIKARFENRFYRRITSAQFDVRYLATNAEKFNERHSQIVKQARLITDICLRIIKETTELDITALYHELVDAYQSSDTEVDVEDDIDKPTTSTNRPRRSKTSRSSNITQTISSDWRVACRQLLETLWQCEDSIPFREPVDRLEHPDYYQVIDTPMDLGTVKENLLAGNYESPTEFAKDVKLIFTNSKTYNTNTRQKIYSMTIRLAAMFEEHIRKIINKWKSVTRQKDPNKTVSRSKVKGKRKSKSKKGSPTKNNLTNGAGPTKRKANSSSDDDDDEDDNDDAPMEHGDEDEDDDHSVDFTPTKRPSRQVNHNGAGPSTLTNRYSNRSSKQSRPSLRPRNAKRKMESDHSDEDEENSDEVSSSSCESSDDNPPKRRTRSRKSDATTVNGHDRDFDEMYEPNAKGKQSRNHRAKNSERTRPNRTPEKRYVVDNDEEEEEQDEQLENEEGDEDHFAAEQSDDSEEISRRNKSSRKVRASAVRNKIQDSTSKDEESNVQEGAGLAVDNEIEDGQEQGEVPNKEKEEEKDEEVAEDVGAGVQKNGESDSKSSSGTTKYQLRSRGRKRHYERIPYNDYSDDDDDDDEDYNEDSYDSVPPATTQLRRYVKRPYYGEASDEDQSSSQPGLGGCQDMTLSISVSSRGRVRKMTPKAISALR